VHDSTLSIPRSILKAHLINLSEIKSVETYSNSKKIIAASIGRVNKSSIFVERRHFDSDDEFDAFVGYLSKFPSINTSKQSADDIASITARRETTKFSFAVFFSLILSATYLLTATTGIEEISDIALNYGGLIKETLLTGQAYRIASSFFLHFTPFHLGLNLVFLGIVGKNVEIILGRVRFINILLLSAISGSLLSLAFSDAETVVGASGGLLGLFGAYLLVCLKYQRDLPGSVSVAGKTVLCALILQVLFDLTSENVDIYSHLGGFLFGFLYATLALNRRKVVNAIAFLPAEQCGAAIFILAYMIGILYFFALYFSILV
jgi:rhomboid protease GluP